MTPIEGILWLALNCYKEAPYEPFQAKIAVSHVVMNRAKKCGTNYKTEILRQKQFSWTISRKFKYNPDNFYYQQCVEAAEIAVNTKDITYGSEFYHTKAINPRWSKNKIRINDDFDGSHYFYKDDNEEPDYCNVPMIRHKDIPVFSDVAEIFPDVKKVKVVTINKERMQVCEPSVIPNEIKSNESENAMQFIMFLYMVNQL